MTARIGSESVERHAGYVSIAETIIDAPAAAVWPRVLDFGAWIYDFHFDHISGPTKAEGEVMHLWPVDAEGLSGVSASERRPENAIVLKTVTIIPRKLWYGINPPTDDGAVRSTGVNLVLLTETGDGTLVTTIRSKESLCPTEEVRDATQETMTRYQPVAQARWTEKYLPRLKDLVEQRR